MRSKSIFISFSRTDQEAVDQLTKALSPLLRDKSIHVWSANAIIPGPGRVPAELESADVILLLVSMEFMANDDCREQVLAAMRRMKRGAETGHPVTVLPIILSACHWQSSPFGDLAPLPKGAQPIAQWHFKDEAYRDVSFGIFGAIEALDQQRDTTEPDPSRKENLLQNLVERTNLNFGMGAVRRILDEREPSATSAIEDAPKPLGSVLRVSVGGDEAGRTRLFGSVYEVTESVLSQFVELMKRERQSDPGITGALVYHEMPPKAAVRHEAEAQDIEILSLRDLKERTEMRMYLAELAQQRASDPVYARALYVEPCAVIASPSFPKGEETDGAAEWITARLLHSGPQIMTVRSEVGGGKTFLLRELTRRMTSPSSPRIPVLVRREALEQSESLTQLVKHNFEGTGGSIRPASFIASLAQGRTVMLFDDVDVVVSEAPPRHAARIARLVEEAFRAGARVILASRTTERHVRVAIEEKLGAERNYFAMTLRPFSVDQIRSLLVKKLRSDSAGKQRYERVKHVPDLLTLAHNPRMLSIVSEIDEEELESAASHEGKATPSMIYRQCVERWIEADRVNGTSAIPPHERSLRRQMETVMGLAAHLWQRRAHGFYVRDLPPNLQRSALALGLEDASPEPPSDTLFALVGKTMRRERVRAAAGLVGQGFRLFNALTGKATGTVKAYDELLAGRAAERLRGAGTLFTRDERQAWSFLHESLLDWFVAVRAAEELRGNGQSAVLEHGLLSKLAARFLIGEAGKSLSGEWAAHARERGHEPGLSNAEVVERLLGIQVGTEDTDVFHVSSISSPEATDARPPVSTPARDLRRKDLSGANLRGRDLRFSDLRDARLVGADLSGALLEGARLNGADLSNASLVKADLTGANLSFARLMAADLTGVKVSSDTRLLGAKLVSARMDDAVLSKAQALGATGAATPSLEPVFGASPSACHCLAYSADGRLLSAGHHDGTLRLYAARGGGPIRILWRGSNRIRSVAFSSKSGVLATAGADQVATIWDVAKGTILHELRGHSGAVMALAFSPDGSQLATAAEDRSIVIWDVLAGAQKKQVRLDASAVNLAFVQDGAAIVAGLSDGSVARLSSNGQVHIDAVRGPSALIASVAFHLSSGVIAFGSSEGTVRVWHPASPDRPRSFEMGTRAVLSLAFSPSGDLLAGGTAQGIISLWNLQKDPCERKIEGHSDSVRAIAFSPDGKSLATGSADQSVMLWDVATCERKRAVSEAQRGIFVPATSVAFHPRSDLLATGWGEHTITWQVGTGEVVNAALGHLAHVSSVAFSSDGTSLASASDDRTVLLWPGSGGAARRILRGHGAPVRGVAFCPTGRFLATVSNDGTARLFGLPDGESLRVLIGHTDYVRALAWSPDGSFLATASDDRTVRLWSVPGGEERGVLTFHTAYVLCVAFHPGGMLVASGSRDETVAVWDARSGSRKEVLRGHLGPVRGVAFSPDGSLLVTCSDDQTIRVWSTSTWTLLMTLSGHRGYVSGVAFHPSGRVLASASGDGTVRVWETSSGRWLATLLKLPGAWVAFSPNGRYRAGGDLAGTFWHVSGLCRFEPGEIDPYVTSPMRLGAELGLVPTL